MDFIEKIFGISPDGGDGSTELLYIVALVAVVTAFVLRRVVKRQNYTPSS
jgi:hypothetical protein